MTTQVIERPFIDRGRTEAPARGSSMKIEDWRLKINFEVKKCVRRRPLVAPSETLGLSWNEAKWNEARSGFKYQNNSDWPDVLSSSSPQLAWHNKLPFAKFPVTN